MRIKFCEYESKANNNVKCSAKLTEKQADWCEKNKEKYGGKYYCYNHQQRLELLNHNN